MVSSQLDILLLAIAQGNIAEAEGMMPLAAAALSDTNGFHTWVWSLRVELARAQIALAKGDLAAASEHAAMLLAQAERTGRVKYVVAGQRVLAACHQREARSDEAAKLLRSSASVANKIGYPALLVQVTGELLSFSDAPKLAAVAAERVDGIVAELDDDALRTEFEQTEAVQRIRAASRPG